MRRAPASPTATLLRHVRVRLRWAWALATLQWVAPAVAVVALGLVVLGRFRPWAWTEPAALLIAVLAIAAVALCAVLMRVPRRVAAMAADVGLDTRDAFTTELEVGDDSPFADAVHARATRLAAGRRSRDAVPWPWHNRRIAGVVLVGATAVALAVAPNPQDDIRAREASERAALAAIAEELQRDADAIDARPEATEEERAAAEELRRLAEELRRADDLAEAEMLARQAEAELRAAVPFDQLGRKAAARGLERSLDDQPLPGSPTDGSGSPEQQLQAAADALPGMSEMERAELADRLEELAEGQRLGDPETSAALTEAASAVRSGATSQARARLGEAGRAAGRSADRVAAGASQQAAAAAAARAAERARTGASGQGDGDGNGDGDGDGDGNGQGNGNGNGSGQGQGQGQGQGGNGSPSGNVGGAKGGTGQGQGGQASAPSSGDSSGDETPDLSGSGETPEGGDGEDLDLGGTPTGDDPGDTVGLGDGPTQAGAAGAAAVQVPEEYRQRATEALDSAAIPPQLRDVITRYFDCLAGRCQAE